MPAGDSTATAPKVGKQGTKGQKQIVEENKSTLKFYLNGIIIVNAVYLALTFLFFWDSFTTFYIVLYTMVLAGYFGAYKFMNSMGSPTYDPAGTLTDGGIDLNMESGMAEHCKDLMILMAIVQILSLISNYFWLGLLMAPGRAFWMLWVNILSPWFFAPPPEVDEKKQKKQERRMKRQR